MLFRTMNDLLVALSAAHFGAFTARDAYDCGYHRQSLSQLVRTGRARRVGPGAYVVSDGYEAASPERRHEMTTRAVVRTFEGRVYASHYSALTLMSLPVFGASLEQVHVSRRVDTALAAGKITMVDLQTWLDRLSRHRQVTQARQVVRLADARSESVGESRTRVLLHALGFEPTPQVKIRDEHGGLVGRVDFLLEAQRVIVEFDGLLKYADAHGREALAQEKSREDRLRALGYEFVRLTWADLSRPATVERLMRQALRRASARRAH